MGIWGFASLSLAGKPKPWSRWIEPSKYIAGYTSGGVAYGVTWEEWE